MMQTHTPSGQQENKRICRWNPSSHGQVALSDLRRMFQKESSEMQVRQGLDKVQTVKDSEYSKPPTY